ncbi:nitronate monooxygenase [Bradyrhizobium sp. Pear77]|uniref:NAD(P)H-dependent flavin oxidoreductase n=1 Tax=Bradyrhizobium TaxID=374 RepID=UPI001E45E991|nr:MULTISPECIES: nitronate monooxygenase family protein [Bradyrhizobium]MCC8958118.1 nitronate monooxygenase [Bradyrhizobium altum]MCC8967173.1 nitronate monooxygenase [Bradyrhizobium oropedii]
MRTEICKRLGIEFPIFAFSHCRDVVAEASKAGAFGVLGAVGFTPEQFARELDLLDKAVGDRPYGVDVVVPTHDVTGAEKDPETLRQELFNGIPQAHQAYAKKILSESGVPELPQGTKHEGEYLLRSTAATARRHVEIALQHPNVRVVANALGAPPPEMVQAIKASGRLVAGLCGKPEHARRHAAAGVDIIVAQGTEGGGHTGEIGSVVLWPEVVEAVKPIPVLAAGGVGSGAQIAAAMVLGAQGVWCGSLWLTTIESELNETAKELLISAKSSDTVRSRSQTGKPSRMLRNRWTEAWDKPDAPRPLPLPLQDMISAECSARARAYPAKAREVTINPVGQIVGRLNQVSRTRDVVAALVEEYLEAADRLNKILEADLYDS